MGQKYDYSYYAYKKTKNTSGKTIFVYAVVLSLIITVVGMIFCSSQTGVEVIIKERECFAISLGRFQNETMAQSFAKSVQSRGGAGYLYCDDGFYVLASGYFSKSDAEKVCKRLVKNGEKAEVVSIKTKLLKKWVEDKNQAELYHKCEKLFERIFVDCNSFAVDIENDKRVSLSQLKQQADELYDCCGNIEGEIFVQLKKLCQNLKTLSNTLQPYGLRFVAFSAFFAFVDIGENM